MRVLSMSIGLALLGGSAFAKEPLLGQPVDCTLNETCYIQQYLDQDASDGWKDYQCSSLSYEGHKGTDFALPTLEAMNKGVNVIAAAPGKVVAVRDGMDDEYYTKDSIAKVAGRDCGNRVAISHGAGWITDYCHLKKGSVALKKGDRVAMGDVLGQIGMSGRAQFPHLHFSVQHRGKPVDPFAPKGVTTCAAPVEKTLWLDTPEYQAGGLIEIGFAPDVPKFAAVKAGKTPREIEADAPNLVLWLFAYGLKTGDVIDYGFTGPEGVNFSNSKVQEKNQAQLMRLGGKRRTVDVWPSGEYVGVVTVTRAGKTLDTKTHSFTLP